MATHLLSTKLFIPSPAKSLIARARLVEKLNEGLGDGCRLTLVSAPAGFGKTTLVAAFVSDCGMPVAWLSLDKNDNQISSFLNYLVACLHKADNSIGSEAAQLVAASPQAPADTVLTSLINDMEAAGRKIVMVLDDYQFISSQAVHEEVAFLLEHCPNVFHLVITTRSDPPLPLARLRADGQTVELRAADLRFTTSEAAQFLNDVMGLNLDARSVTLLEERTEGWIAGLQMAALSMRDRNDVPGFIEGFSGTHRYILDYLLEEVLTNQPAEVQRFLLCTSILERLTAPLCDAVLANNEESKVEDDRRSTGSEIPLVDQSASTLEYLERSNLFLVPLDDERTWYRYHHLFADLLHARLDQVYPGQARQLHMHAAAWLEHEGMTVDAVNHALAAGMYDHAAHLVEENTTRLLAQGEMNTLLDWIEILPAELRLKKPWLCVHQASALMFAGRSGEVEPMLAQAETIMEVATQTGPADKPDRPSMGIAEARALKGTIAAVRAFTIVAMGQDAEGLSQAQQAGRLLTVGDPFIKSLVAWAIGRIMLNEGRLSEARLAFEEQFHLGQAGGHIWATMGGLTYLAQVLHAEGHLPQARALLEEALAEASRQGARGRGFIAWVEDNLASVLYEQNELEAADRLLAEAIMLILMWPNPTHLIYAHTLQARVLLARGELQGARMAIGQADLIRRNALMSRWIRHAAEAELVRVWLATLAAGASLAPGDPLAEQSGAVVAAWRSELASLTEDDQALMDEYAEIVVLNLARVSLVAGRAEEALSWLERLTRSARTTGHTDAAINSLVLTAIAEQRIPARQARGAGQAVPALTALEDALSLAEAGGYVRVFLNEGQPMRMLLTQWLAHAGPGPVREYAIRLLSQFDAEMPGCKPAHEKVPVAGNLMEPLSQRELEVLHLMALGKTNQEIAQQLIVARGTIKAHTANIFRKLEVANRTEAVARARQLSILP